MSLEPSRFVVPSTRETVVFEAATCQEKQTRRKRESGVEYLKVGATRNCSAHEAAEIRSKCSSCASFRVVDGNSDFTGYRGPSLESGPH